MILVDSVYINSGGGLVLLKLLISHLDAKGVNYFLLADKRCQSEFTEADNKCFISGSIIQRHLFYLRNAHRFNAIFCFANIPPTLKLNCPIYTYFHNVSLLKPIQFKINSIINYLKYLFINHHKLNTNLWIVQTSHTLSLLSKALNIPSNNILTIPFYHDCIHSRNESKKKSFEYVYVGDYYNGAKGHDELLSACEILHAKSINITLHLTITNTQSNVKVLNRITKLHNQGINIINHGSIPHSSIFDLYNRCKATIYPSHDESLGLGLIEACNCGCDIIAPDLPYVHAICNPTLTFKPFSPASIAETIQIYEHGGHPQSELITKNEISKLIYLLNSLDIH